MAAKFTITDLDINVDSLLNKQAEVKASTVQLTEAQKALKKETGNLTTANEKQLKQYAANEAELKKLNQEYNVNKNVLAEATTGVKTLTDALQKENRTEEAAKKNNKELIRLRQQVNVKTKEGQQAVTQINKKIDENNRFLKTNASAMEKQRLNIGNYASGLDRIVPGLGSVSMGIHSMTNASLRFIATPIGAILAGIVLVLASLRAAFTSSEEGQNRFNKLWGQINVVLGNLSDVLANVGMAIIDMVTNPIESIKGFGKSLFNNILLPLKEILLFIPRLGKAAGQLFVGDFSGASETAKKAVFGLQAGIASLKDTATDAFSAATDGVKDFIKETKNELNLVREVEDLKAETDKLERKQLVERARLESEIAELRLKSREEDKFAAEERLEFLKQARQLGDQLAAVDEQIATNRAKIIQQENAFSKSTKENLDAQARAEAEVFKVQAARANFNRTLQRDLIRVAGQARKEVKESVKALQERLKKEQELQNEFDMKRREAEAVKFQEKLVRLEEEGATELQLKIAQLEREEQLEKESLDRRIAAGEGFERERETIEKRFALKRIQIRHAEEAAKLQLTADILGQIAGLFNEQTGIAKALAVAQATISTYKAAAAALEPPPIGAGPVFGPILAGVTIARGLAQVSRINSTNIPKFAKGGLMEVGGKRHAAGGTKFYGEDGTVFEAEKGELVGAMNRGAASLFKQFNDKALNGNYPVTPVMFSDEKIVDAIKGSKSKTHVNIHVQDGMKYEVINNQTYLN